MTQTQTQTQIIRNQFTDALLKLTNHLYKEDLYSEGLVMINYDRIDKEFKICEQSDTNSISGDEYPNQNNNYHPEQIRIISIDVADLKEAYNDSLRENNTDEEADKKDGYYLWEAIVDNTIEIAEEQQMDAEIEDIVNNFVN